MNAAIINATTRFFTKEQLSFRSYARLSAVMYELIAPVTDQTASTKPAIVIRMLDSGFASARFSDPSSSRTASGGITPVRCCIRLEIVAGVAISVKRPVTTISTDGIAKNELYASADASIIALSFMNSLDARIKIAFQSANVRSRKRGSG